MILRYNLHGLIPQATTQFFERSFHYKNKKKKHEYIRLLEMKLLFEEFVQQLFGNQHSVAQTHLG